MRSTQLVAGVALALLVAAGIGAVSEIPPLAIGAGLTGSLLMLWLGYHARQ